MASTGNNWKQKIWIVIPAFNEAGRIGGVLVALRNEGYTNICVIDDCSEDETASVASRFTKNVLSHAVNRGPGAATSTGLEFAKQQDAEIVLTLDADGQHAVSDIQAVVQPILEGTADVVIGARTINRSSMPLIRRIGNFGLNAITFILFQKWVSDSQSGFKAFSSHALSLIRIRLDRYEFCSEMIHEISRNKLRCIEVPVQTIYTRESYAKGQSVLGGIRTAWGMMKRFLLK